MKTIKLVPMALVALFAFNSCSNDDDAQPVNEEEVITTVTMTLTPTGGGNAIELTSRDLDGDGPNAPTITVSGKLVATTTYNGTISLLNELTTPADNISAEVLEEGDEHQFFYTAPGVGTFAYTDQDVNSRPIGLTFTFTTAANAQSGNLTVILKHEPNKTAEGVAAGNIANAGGETDLQVTFPVTVQ